MAKPNKTYTVEEQERSDAVDRYLKGERRSKICKSLGRSRVWLRKWIGRYNDSEKSSKTEWFRDESRAPKNVHRKTDSGMEQLVITVRKSLLEGTTEDTKYRCIGAVEIQFHMHELGYSEDEMPSLSTIKRIVKRNGLVVQNRKRYIRCKSKKRYTLLNPTKANEVHQMDFVGPRHIKGYGRISSLNLIDVVSSKAHIRQYAGQTMDNVLEFLLGYWTENAIPNYLQMDNGASFIGDVIHSRHFSRVVRLCLHLGVEPVFIAPRKPWMNGKIEDFNGDFGEKLGEREQFGDLEHIRGEAKIFLMRHNNRQDWKYRKTDMEAVPQRRVPVDFEINANSLPITEGKVHFIRQVKGNGTISVLNEDFSVGESLAHEYVWAAIDTKQGQLMIYYREKNEEEAGLIKIYEYEIGENVKIFEEKF
jgi:transposase InsO family protein